MEAADTRQERVPTESASPLDDRLAALHALFPEAFSEGEIDFDRLRAALGDVVDDRRERYSFAWAGKQAAIRAAQKASEMTLMPNRAASVHFDTAHHAIVEGDNLEVLKILYRSYYGRVRTIYIDPPYNTGRNEFVYEDDFTAPPSAYLRQTGQVDANGNHQSSGTETNGRKHSNWLSMMYPRLFLARQLLRDDGLIYVSIDDHEVHSLRLLMDEVFGEENFMSLLTWRSGHTVRNTSRDFSKNTEFVLCYCKNKGATFLVDKGSWLRQPMDKADKYPYNDNDGKGPYKYDPLHARNYNRHYVYSFKNGKKWSAPQGEYPRYAEETLAEMEAADEIYFGGKEPQAKRYLWRVQEGVAPSTLLPVEMVGFSMDGTSELAELLGHKAFDQPKPVSLVKHLLRLDSRRNRDAGNNDIILDFFAGSGTTLQAVVELNIEDGGNRRCILVQLPQRTPEASKARSAGYSTIAEITLARARSVTQRIERQAVSMLLPNEQANAADLGFRTFSLATSAMRNWEPLVPETSPEAYVQSMVQYGDTLLGGWTADGLITEVYLREGYSLTSRIERDGRVPHAQVCRVVDDEREQHFLIALDDALTLDTLRPLRLQPDDTLICRDSALDDTTAANLALQCRLKTY